MNIPALKTIYTLIYRTPKLLEEQCDTNKSEKKRKILKSLKIYEPLVIWTGNFNIHFIDWRERERDPDKV